MFEDSCDIKQIVIILLGTLCVVVGVYLAAINEKASVASGRPKPQTASGELKSWTFRFRFQTGIVLVLMGLINIFLSYKYNSCNNLVRSDVNVPVISTKQNAIVEGWVKDDEGNNVGGVLISINGRNETGQTGPDGHFLISLKDDAEEVEVLLSAPGYREEAPIIKATNSEADYIIHKL